MAKLYKVELVASYPQDTHHRAGLVISKGGPLFTGLSKDQLEAIKNDNQLKVSEATAEDQAAVEAASGESASEVAEDGQNATEDAADQGDEAAEDQAAGEEEAADGDAAGDAGEDLANEPAQDDESEGSDSAEGEEAGEDSSADEAGQESVENNAGEEVQPTAEELARDHSRQDLDTMAEEAGVVEPKKLENKLQVAQAIVEKRG